MFAVVAVYMVEAAYTAVPARVYIEVYIAPAEPDTAVEVSFYLFVCLISWVLIYSLS
jgi:hypothetical protein